jgi:hypothetical protein
MAGLRLLLVASHCSRFPLVNPFATIRLPLFCAKWEGSVHMMADVISTGRPKVQYI